MHFHSGLAIFHPSSSQFEANLASFHAFLTKKISMLGCRSCRHQKKLNISSSARCMNRQLEIIDVCSTPTLSFSANEPPNLNQMSLVLTPLWPKTQVCWLVDHGGTNKNSILVHQQGLWTLGWESAMHFHSSLTILHQSNPQFHTNVASFDVFLTKKISNLGRRSCRHQ